MKPAPFITTIGLEVHVQLGLQTKLFSHAPHAFGGQPNSRVTATDLGLPGVMPQLNLGALDLALRAALALDASIAEETSFARKHYFYPDLPKGYQITQVDQPYCHGGRVPLGSIPKAPETSAQTGRLHHIHLEEDAGKTIHTEQGSKVDLNRAGTALIEIVGEPDLRSPSEARDFLDSLKQILQYAGVSDCDMEKGSLRCDANISVRPEGQDQLGTRVEIKNLNSFRMVERALEFEAKRQRAVLTAGGRIQQETRGWNDERSETTLRRSKADAPDYRFLPEPDIPPVTITEARIEAARRALPELPRARMARFRSQYQLDDTAILLLTRSLPLSDYFEALAQATENPLAASRWIQTEVLRALKADRKSISDFPLEPERLAELIAAETQKKISHQAAKRVFDHMLQEGSSASSAIETLGLFQVSDPRELQPIVLAVLAQNSQSVTDFKQGKEKALHALKGLCMRKTGGRADPAVIEDLLRSQLDS